MMNLQTAEQLQNLIGVKGEVMTFWQGRAVLLNYCVNRLAGYSFRGLDRRMNYVEINVPLANATTPMFVITSKARVNWPGTK
jgi:hypothetical protein